MEAAAGVERGKMEAGEGIGGGIKNPGFFFPLATFSLAVAASFPAAAAGALRCSPRRKQKPPLLVLRCSPRRKRKPPPVLAQAEAAARSPHLGAPAGACSLPNQIKKRDIVRPSVTRFASNFLTLQSLYEKKDQLRMMSQSDEWEKISHVKKSAKGVQATATLVKPNFWNGVALSLRVFEPLVKVLRMVDGDVKPSMAFLYGEIVKAKKDILVAIGNIDKTGNLYKSILRIIDAKMKDRLDSPLHKAAYFLNPYYSYNDASIFESEEVMDGFITAVETYYHGDFEKQEQVLNEDLHKFKDQVGHFSKLVAMNGCKNYDFSPAKWWGNYGTQAPILQKMAIKILYLTSSASGCERNWSCYEAIHTKKRNKLSCDRLEQIVFDRFNNLHADKKNKAQKNTKADPILAAEATSAQGWIVEGGEDNDDSDCEPVTGLTWKLIAETCGAEEVTRL